MTSAWVRLSDGVIETIAMADPAVDVVPPGYRLVALPDGLGVDDTWTWTEAAGFINPNPPPPVEGAQ